MKQWIRMLHIRLLELVHKRAVRRVVLFVLGGVFGAGLLVLTGLLILILGFQQKIYPRILVGPVPVGGMSQGEAVRAVSEAVSSYLSRWPVLFLAEGRQLPVYATAETIRFHTTESVDQAYQTGRVLSLDSIVHLWNLSHSTITVPLEVTIDPEWLSQTAASMAAELDSPAVPPRIDVVTMDDGTKQVNAVAGVPGRVVDQTAFITRMTKTIQALRLPEQAIEMKIIDEMVTPEQMAAAEKRAQTLLTQSLVLVLPQAETVTLQQWELSGEELVQFVSFADDFHWSLVSKYVAGVAEVVDRPPKDAKFNFDEASGKVTEFVPAENGIVLDVPQATAAIVDALTALSKGEEVGEVELVINTKPPQVTLADVNRLGISERIGVGTSTYHGSIASRVHNVALAAARLNGTLIKPGEEFSFNGAVGEISAATGYQAAYIISGGRTILGDGGGVCQDSTTVFRAALDAGLPITQRRAHAYRVGYYEQDTKPGLDATVYSPTTDFRFLNDTPGHILLQASADSANRALTVVLYGTSDGRKSTISDHVVWDVTPPPPDVYVDDPTLAPGQVKQIDWRASGAKAKFTYTVTRNGETVYEKTFSSVYRPWAAVYLRGVTQ
jgi:vancomycin resistance protein YoaR